MSRGIIRKISPARQNIAPIVNHSMEPPNPTPIQIHQSKASIVAGLVTYSRDLIFLSDANQLIMARSITMKMG
jgi:hypothetical protein